MWSSSQSVIADTSTHITSSLFCCDSFRLCRPTEHHHQPTDDEAGEKMQVRLIEFNSFGAAFSSGAALFSWVRDYSLLCGGSGGGGGGGGGERSSCAAWSTEAMKDVIDVGGVSSGSGCGGGDGDAKTTQPLPQIRVLGKKILLAGDD